VSGCMRRTAGSDRAIFLALAMRVVEIVQPVDRRTVLRALGIAVPVVAVAGCTLRGLPGFNPLGWGAFGTLGSPPGHPPRDRCRPRPPRHDLHWTCWISGPDPRCWSKCRRRRTTTPVHRAWSSPCTALAATRAADSRHCSRSPTPTTSCCCPPALSHAAAVPQLSQPAPGT
jgi:hypothetical protein